ncbi:MAG: hypothetical protein D8M58_20905 [Calditrichaeota bacterium]|nr:MAG: hypothetical protein DWQ03_16620 [Calditrichota bacterium]MBL1207871.1 hypothetical protein [Calditrichota bacterium]NOG47706.1 hypothetical protein [Calditrichota bacterium]
MSNLSVQQFSDAVTQWAGRRNGQFKYNWTVNGGWEGWIQVDLTAYILSVDSRIEILREQSIFTSSRKKVDLLLNVDLDTDYQIPVEIKAESFFNRNRFVSGVNGDLKKLNDERNTDFSESTSIMLALPFSQGAVDRVLSITWENHRIFRSIFTGEVACLMAVWTEPDGWLRA